MLHNNTTSHLTRGITTLIKKRNLTHSSFFKINLIQNTVSGSSKKLIHSPSPFPVLVGMKTFHYSLKSNNYINEYGWDDGGIKGRLKLPPSKDPSKKTLVLDLYEVLVTFNSDGTNRPTYCAYGRTMVKREGIDEFLLEMAKHYEIVVLTSAVKSCANVSIAQLPKVFEHRRYRHDLPGLIQLPVRDMGRPMDRIILIEGYNWYLQTNPDNVLQIPSINARKSDDNLKKLSEDLLRIANDEISIEEVCHKWNKVQKRRFS